MSEKYNFICPCCKKQRNISLENLNVHPEYLEECFYCRRTSTTRNTNMRKYGVICYTQTSMYKKKHKQTYKNMSDLKKTEIDEKRRLTNLKKYGVENNSQLAVYKKSISEKNHLNSKERVLKIKQTNLKKYGVENVSQLQKVKTKKESTCLLHFGEKYYAQTDDFQKLKKSHFSYDSMNFDSKPELAFWIWCKDHNKHIKRCEKCFEFKINNISHNYFPDFQVDDILIELKGDHFVKKDGTWQNPFDHTQDALYEAKHQCALKNNVRILYSTEYQKYLDYVNEKYTNDFLDLFRTNSSFPYLNNNFIDKSDLGLIRYFHKSIYKASHKGCLSPQQAWEDKNIVKKVALNRLQYIKACDPETILKGFSVTRIAPKVSVFRPKLAEDLIKDYLNEYKTIVDPFSGFSGRLLGAYNCNKTYIGKDINEDHVKESNEIIQFKNMQNATVTVEDLLKKQDIEEYDCLFTCPPYGGKEHWNENNDEVEKSCDEWIDLCLQHYKCKSYLFVVDDTEKYKNHIVKIINKKEGMFSRKGDKVIFFNISDYSQY